MGEKIQSMKGEEVLNFCWLVNPFQCHLHRSRMCGPHVRLLSIVTPKSLCSLTSCSWLLPTNSVLDGLRAWLIFDVSDVLLISYVNSFGGWIKSDWRGELSRSPPGRDTILIAPVLFCFLQISVISQLITTLEHGCLALPVRAASKRKRRKPEVPLAKKAPPQPKLERSRQPKRVQRHHQWVNRQFCRIYKRGSVLSLI